MKRHKEAWAVTALAVMVCLGTAMAADSGVRGVNIQGFLTERAGGASVPANGTFTMSFDLYDAPAGGTLLATAGPLDVEVVEGRYSVRASFDTTGFDDGVERYVEIVVGDDILAPRSLVIGAPFGYVAQNVEGRVLQESPVAPDAAATQQGPPPDEEDNPSSSDYENVERRHLEWLRYHTDDEGFVRPDLWYRAVQDTENMKIAAWATVRSTDKGAGGVTGVQWVQVGPEPLEIDKEQIFQGSGPDSGEVLDVAIDPRNTTDTIIYIATNQGGIWKSTDGGDTWEPKTDFMPSLSMGAVALHPGNPSIVYAGTGNLFDGGGVVQFLTKAVGIYRSIDSGETWTILNPGGIFTNNGIHRIVFPPADASDPAGADVVLVASQNGVYRSVDGGLNFGNNPPDFDNGARVLNGFISDLKLDTTAAGTVHAAVFGTGIFRSTDSGRTFPTNLFTTMNGAPDPTTNLRFIWFAQSTMPDDQTLYAAVQGPDPGLGDSCRRGRNFVLSKSTDYGATWTPLPQGNARATGKCCQCGYDQTVGVDPVDADRVYIAFQEMFCSIDGGANFPTPACTRDQTHWDHHAITFSPPNHRTMGDMTTRIWTGTDGGVHYSDDGGASWANKNETIATNILFHMDMGRGSATNNDYIYGGCQDTGTVHTRPAYGKRWHLSIDGDGQGVAVDRSDPMKAYGGGNNGYFKTVDGGDNWTTPGGAPPGSFRQFVDRNDGHNVYVITSNNLYQSTDTGNNFTLIHSSGTGANLRVLEMVALDSNTMWLGLTDGTLEYTENLLAGAGSTWTAVTIPGAPNQTVTGIALDPLNTDRVVVVYPGYCGGACAAGDRTRHVLYTTDKGQTWTDISGTDGGGTTGDLPDLPVMSVVLDPDTSPHSIIVSTITGVMRSSNLGATWERLGLGLPVVHSRTLQIDPEVNPTALRVGTYGRSVFELDAAQGPLLGINADLAFGPACVGGNDTRIVQMFNVGSEDITINSFFRLSGSTDFEIISGPATPVTIPPGEELDWTVRYQPTSQSDASAVFQINSDDQFEPEKQLPASGMGVVQNIATVIADNGDFGDVCLGTFKDLDLTITNSGFCDLTVTDIMSTGTNASEFTVPGVVTFPLVIGPGDSLAVPIRFEPTSDGTKSATINVFSDDPDTTPMPATVAVSGYVPLGDVRVTGSTDFGDVCAGTLAEKSVSVCNVGACNLNVSSVSFDPPCDDFELINNPFPAPVSPDSCQDVVVRFTPTSDGMKSCVLKIVTDDPDEPVITKTVTGNTPEPSIDVPPDQGFPPTVIQRVDACQSMSPFPVSNTGTCDLVISDMSITLNDTEFSLMSLPSFPVILEPGHIAGEGALNNVFAPRILGREHQGMVTVTYVSDSITGDTTQVTRLLCGEGVYTGARVLVTQDGIPLDEVESIKLQRLVGNRNKNRLDTVDNARNLTLQTFTPSPPCGSFQYHREYGTASNMVQLAPGSYQVTVTAIVEPSGKRKRKTVGFDVTSCDFNPTVIVDY